MWRLSFRQKCILVLIALTLTFIAFSKDRVTLSHLRVIPIPRLFHPEPVPVHRPTTVRLPTPKPQPLVVKNPSPKLYFPRTSFPNTVTFRLKEDPFQGTTTTTLSPYREVRMNETCKVFPGVIRPGVKGSKIEGKMFDPNTCLGSEFVDVPDMGDIVKYGKFATPNTTCCLKVKVEVPKKKGQTKAKIVDQCHNIPINGILKTKLEFVELNCSDPVHNMSNRWEFHSRFVPKAGAQLKKKQWEEALKAKNLTEPPSILILGLSSFSNRQFKQLLPHTNDLLLKEMGFIAYDLYLKSGENVPASMFGMLTGTDLNSVANSTTVPAPKIVVNDFNRIKYTSYCVIQDYFYSRVGALTFSTDYTTNSLLDTYHQRMLLKDKPACTQHNLLQEILSFTTKFLTEYKSVPSFATLWLDLFHESIPNQALPSADKLLKSFFSKNRNILKNTIVILVSDQGSHNYSDFGSQGFFANNFPALYIHYPKHFKSKPGVSFNQNIPISAKDIYNTLQRTLLEACAEVLKSPKPFPAESVRVCKNLKLSADTVALWDKVKPNRDCKTLEIPHTTVCQSACQVDPKAASMEPMSTFDLEDVGHYLINYLNQFIQDYFFKKVMINCHFWVLDIDAIRFSQILRAGAMIKEGMNFTRYDILVVIKVQPDRPNPTVGQLTTEFKTLVRVDKSEDTMEMSVLEFPKRILQSNEILHKYTKCVIGDRNISIAEVCYCKSSPRFKFRHIIGRPDY